MNLSRIGPAASTSAKIVTVANGAATAAVIYASKARAASKRKSSLKRNVSIHATWAGDVKML